MGTRKLMVTSSLMLAVAALLAAVAVFRATPALGQPEQPPEGRAEPGRPPEPFPPGGPSGLPPAGPGGTQGFPRFAAAVGGPVALTAHGDFVYVVRGNTLYQFAVEDLRLIKKVALEEEPRVGPPGAPRKAPVGDRPQLRERE